MRVFVAFGYNDRDRWIQDQVFRVLKCMGFTVVDGKDLVGQPLSVGVAARIQQSDAAVGFFTIREGQENAEYNSHQWVLQEMNHAHALKKPIVY
jgi:hypothetical protein